MDVRIFPPEEMIEASVSLPLSKSISNRALILDALTPGGASTEVADCDDTRALRQALADAAQGRPQTNVGPAGTAMRFFTAYAAATPGLDIVIDGDERMRQRPIGPLVDALRACSASIEYMGQEGFPPLKVAGRRLKGGNIEIDATVSSQFLSALLMVAPTMESALRLELKGEPASLPYLQMTLAMMRERGAKAELYRGVVTVEPGQYAPCTTPVERDWSAASYWYAVAAMSAGWVTLQGMQLPSLQGDSVCAQLFEKLGVVTEPEDGNLALNPSPEVFSRLDADLSDYPDLAPTLAVACCMLGVPFKFEGLHSLRIKETDRLAALQAELAKLSFAVEIGVHDELSWQMQRVPVEGVAPIDTYGDHRMAMAFAPVSIFVSGLVIRGAEVVSKSYPGFWDDMRSAGFTIEEVAN